MDLYLHIRVLLSIILGLGVAQLLRGVSRIVQHPKKFAVYWVHLVWALFLFLFVIHFWWWEFALSRITDWTFPVYFFLTIYSTVLYLNCTLFFPEDISDYAGFRDYFYSRRAWLFGFLALLFALDFIDTFIKGPAYRAQFGTVANIRDCLFILLCLLAIKIPNRRFHAALACFAVLFEILYIFNRHPTVT